ncbi:MAG: hypothetical protein HC923_10760 [Myxococcales bacterium]|nr:hypothetical protein [Myxococcales bacterium]
MGALLSRDGSRISRVSPGSHGLADILIEPPGLEDIYFLDTTQYARIEELGYEGAVRELDQHESLITKLPRSPLVQRGVRNPELRAAPTLRPPIFPTLPGSLAIRENPERAALLLVGLAGFVGAAWWLNRRRS